jgi:outer membrane lipopolysaccharide assembly protein LptE/RlpB
MVTGHPFEAVVRELTHQLRGAPNLTVVDRIEDAEVVIDISKVERDDEVLTISRAGHVQEYEYFLDVYYRICAKGGKNCQPETTLRLVRQMTYDEGRILAKRNEERFLRRDMEQQAVRLILLRMSRFGVRGQKNNNDDNVKEVK